MAQNRMPYSVQSAYLYYLQFKGITPDTLFTSNTCHPGNALYPIYTEYNCTNIYRLIFFLAG